MRIDMPRLADRDDDVIDLARLFVERLSQQLGLPKVEPGEAAIQAMRDYSWPGNVRELRNLVERSLILGGFPDTIGPGLGLAESANGTLAEVERNHILAVLEASGGNQAEAARTLGISRKTIERKLAAWKSR